MSDQAKRYNQEVVDAVVAGDVGRLEAALRRLSKCDGRLFLMTTRQLLNTNQSKTVCTIATVDMINQAAPFYYEDGVVYGSVYTDGQVFMVRDAHRSGVGIPLRQVASVVGEARAEYDARVLKRVQDLKAGIGELEDLLQGHSQADGKLVNFGLCELLKGQALLIAALNNME